MRSPLYYSRRSCLLVILAGLQVAQAALSAQVQAEVLPSPLTLDTALSLSDSNHPDLLLADANLAVAVSRRLEVGTNNDVEAYFEVGPYASNPATNDHFLNDSYLLFSVTKTLYDFGYSDTMEASADEDVISQELIATDTRNKHYLNIMRHFFDVLLADLHFAAIDEEMTSLYVVYDKLRERQTLGMVDEVELATAESVYRDAADRRKMSEIEQQASRQRLAIALNRPDDIPADLIRPDLPEVERAIPEVDALLDEAFHNNLMLTALEHAMQADRAALKAAQQQYGPTVTAGLELGEFARRLPGRNNASIGVSLHVPLTSSRSQVEAARAAAELSTSQANYDRAKYSLRQNLADLVRRLELLHYKRNTDQLRLNSTALKLEKSRARYEMEIQSTLGNTMAQYTEAEWLSAKNDFDIATTWAQIEILIGKKLYQERGK